MTPWQAASRTLLALHLAVACVAPSRGTEPAPALEIRFVPERGIFPYDLDVQRQISSIVAQNIAVVWKGAGPLTVEAVELELLDGEGQAVESRRLGAATLARAAQRGAGLEQAGLLKLYAFHFHPEQLLGAGVTLAPTALLQPSTALLVGHQVFAFQGERQGLRVRARGRDASGAAIEAQGTSPLRRAAELSKVEFAFPLAGRSFIGAGASLHSHHRWVVPEEFALDIARLGAGGVTYRGSGERRSDYLSYGADVLAAADGTVRSLRDDLVESDAPLRRAGESAEAYGARVLALQAEIFATGGALAAAGNHVVIEHAGGLFSVYAHLQPGSAGARVRVGQAVRRGQVIGALGFSGSATEPHLHFHVVDGPDPLGAAGVPVTFVDASLPFDLGPRALQSGDVVEKLRQ